MVIELDAIPRATWCLSASSLELGAGQPARLVAALNLRAPHRRDLRNAARRRGVT
jgi:hypothetical protein